jgi:hypothetical protein
MSSTPPKQDPKSLTGGYNTLAIVSLAFGIASWLPFPVFGAIVAVVTGHLALGQIKRTGEPGREFAIAGLVLGWIHIALSVVVLAVVVSMFVFGFAIFAGTRAGAHP